MSSPALARALRDVASRIPARRVDHLWIFPPRRAGARESGVVVLSLLPEDGEEPAERRYIHTLRYEGWEERGRLRLETRIVEQGAAPLERVARVIGGVVRRLGGDAAEEPRVETPGGTCTDWEGILATAGVLDAPNQE